MSTRTLSFDRIENFRDFGNYGSRHGGRVCIGRLFRSGHYADATAADLRRLANLQVELITDLRRPTERARDRVPQLPAPRLQIINSDSGDQIESPHLAFLRQTDLTPGSIGVYLTGYYTSAPFEERYRDLFGRYFRALATVAGAAWIHCTAGKDRTGILVALTHDLLGVRDEDIAEDFLFTNQLMQVEQRLSAYGPVLEKLIGQRPTDAAVRAFLGVDWVHLRAMLDNLRERYGSVEEYVMRALGLEARTVEQIRGRLLGAG